LNNTGKIIRLGNLINPQDQRALWLDLSISGEFGAQTSFQNFIKIIAVLGQHADGAIVNPGFLEKSAELFGGAYRWAPIVRADWTNYRRPDGFCLPAKPIQRVMVCDVEDALRLGAEAICARFIMGVSDEFEAENVQSIARLARAAEPCGLPVIAEICPVCENIKNRDFGAVVKLGVACLLEAGVDVLIIPPCTPESLAEISAWVDIPLILKTDKLPDIDFPINNRYLLSENMITGPEFAAELEELYCRIHTGKGGECQ
jgi:DhnA family fructose-bisphosphate aldolase class Ia